VGWGGLSQPSDAPPEIIYGFAKNHWGKGYGSEFVTSLVAHLQKDVGVDEVRATVHPSKY
jgi:RimJ/RimL family protein N-acetyltransferase